MAPANAQPNRFATRDAYYAAMLEMLIVPFKTQAIPTRFGKTHVIISGKDNTDSIVLLHGAGSSAAACWPLINELSKTYCVYSIDIPRHLGKTEPFRLSPKRDDYALWLIDILDFFSLDQAHFIGFSFGGWVTLKLAISARERVAKVVLISPIGVVRFRLMYLLKAPFLLIKALLSRSDKSMNEFARFIAGPTTPQRIVDDIAEAGRVFIQNFYMPSAPTRPSRQELRDCQFPTLVLLAKHDSFCDPGSIVSRLNANLPDGRVEIIPDAGHVLIHEHAGTVNTRILEFLRPGA